MMPSPPPARRVSRIAHSACLALLACVATACVATACAQGRDADALAGGRQQGAEPMHDDRSDAIIELIQGVPWRDPDSGEGIALGEVTATEAPPQARLSLLGPPGSAGWEPEASLREGEIFPFAGGFMELVQLRPGASGERARAVLRGVADAGGIVAPATGSRVLVEGGRAKTDGRWLALTGAGPGGATFEHWRADRARSRLDDADIVRAGLQVDGVLEVDGVRYRLLRLQPQAGQLRAFVELARD